MSSYTRKILLAAGLSFSGIMLSFLWYRWDLMRSSNSDGSPKKLVAYLVQAKNEVQKREAKRVIWQKVDEEEALYSGEAVRTASDAEAKISFKTGAEVDLDPDSVVVIEDSGDKVNLDFVKGNLFVKGGEQGGGGLALKSGNTNISLSGADVALNRDGSGKNIDVQVLRGTAELSNGDKKIILDKDKAGSIGDKGVDVTQQFFKIKAPLAGNKIYIRADKKEPVVFSWSPVPDDYDVTLEAGSQREKLVSSGAAVKGSKGEASAPMKLGTQFWRLKAVNRKDPKQVVYSLLNKVTVLPELPPKLLSPARDAQTVLNPQSEGVDVRWANPSKLARLQLEVAKDAGFQKRVFSEEVEDTGTRAVPLKDDGEYYWRVSGLRVGTINRLYSDVQKFSLSSQFRLTSPELKVPVADAHLPLEKVDGGGVFLVWNSVPGISKYHVRLEPVMTGAKTAVPVAPVVDKDVSDITQIRLPAVKPGQFKWTVVSVDEEGKKSAGDHPRFFTVEELPVVAWSDGKEAENYYYLSETPSLKVAWKPFQQGALRPSRYKVSVKPDNDITVKVVESRGLEQMIPVPSDGLYHVTVEALNDKGLPLARSHIRDVTAQLKPLLPAPVFHSRMPATVQAFKNGSASFAWEPVTGARSYVVRIKSDSGKVTKIEKFSSLSGLVKNLLPGQYKVSLSSVDEFGRIGPGGEERVLRVPDTSDLKAPALRKLQIK